MPVLRPLARIWTALLTLAALALTLGLVARWMLPAAPWVESPALDVSSPVDGAVNVLPRSEVALSFSAPMNRAATQSALRIVPPTPGGFRWSDDARQLIFAPQTTLVPDTDYTISVGGGALGRWWRPLVAPRQIRFRTAPLPAVVAALPNSANTPLDGALAIIFSQAMVPADRIGQPVALPQLHIEPPVSAQMRWLDQTTLLIRSDAPLRAATRYTATISPDLTDLRGVDLGRSYRWSWSTAWPETLDRTPASDARWVSPHQPLTLALSAPLDVPLLRSALRIDPQVEGEITSAIIGATQVVTFTPRLGWEYGRSYRVSLAAVDPAMAAPPDLAWRFNVEPKPDLIAFFPGQGQALQAGQEVRLIFSTPMDAAALRAGLRIDPPVSRLPLEVSETEVRLQPSLRPSTAYTLTVSADTPDRSGEALGITATVRLTTADAEPSLRAPDATAHVISLPISRTAQIALERINISRLDLSLYRLDPPTVVRALGLTLAEWRDFSPERYGQALARSWQLTMHDPVDVPVRDPITVALTDGAPLAPGIYYLRAISPEGPRADMILAVSSVALTLRQSDRQVLIWATDRASGQPVAGVPLALYAGETLITRGQTGVDGVWQQLIPRPVGGAPYLALAEGFAPTLVRGDWLTAPSAGTPPRSRSLIFLDKLAYRPGDSVRIGGVARMLADGGMALPADGTLCRMQLESDNPAAPGPSATCAVAATGAVSGTLRLSPRQPPGDYRMLVHTGDRVVVLSLRVSAEATPIDLSIDPVVGGEIHIHASQAGLPLVGATISWTLGLEPLALPVDPEGYHFDLDLPAPKQISGVGTTDTAGQITLALPARAVPEAALHYQLWAELDVPSGPPPSSQVSGIIPPVGAMVGVRLPSRIVLGNERATVELLARSADGGPAPGQLIGVAIYRRGDASGPPIITRSATSDARGRANVQLVQLRPGAYEIIASLGDSSSRVGLWVASGRYTGWQSAPGQVEVVADRDSYRPGDMARLLVTAPYNESNLLLTTEGASRRSAEVRNLRASQLITLAITPDMAPAINIGAVVAAGAMRLVGDTAIRVSDDRPVLSVTVAADRPQYAPADTMVLSVTSSLGGVPTATGLLITIAPADAPADALAMAQLAPPPPAPPETAMLVPGAVLAAGGTATAGTLRGGEGYLVPVGAGGAGPVILRVPLPNTAGRWRISAYAVAGADQFAVTAATVTTSVPLELTPTAPPSLRPGDRAEASLLVRNTSPVTQVLRVRLQADGGDIDPANLGDRRLLLAPGDAQRLAWTVGPRPGASAVALRYRVAGDNLSVQVIRDLPVLPVGPTATPPVGMAAGGGPTQISLYQEYLDPQSNTPIGPAALRVGQLIALRVTLISARPILQGSLEIVLPSGLQPITLGLRPPFAYAGPISPAARSLRVEAAEIPPGVYSLRVVARVAAVGEFDAPGTRLLRDGEDLPPVVAPSSPSMIVGA